MEKSKFRDTQIQSILNKLKLARLFGAARRFMKTLGFERNSVTMR